MEDLNLTENLKKDILEAPNLEINTVLFLKSLKSIRQTSEKAYVRVEKENLKLRSIDFKEGLGLVDLVIKIKNFSNLKIDFLVDLDNLIKIIDNFTSDLNLFFEAPEKYIVLKESNSKVKKSYILPYQDSKKITQTLQLELFQSKLVEENPLAEIKISSINLINLLKSITAVDNSISFQFMNLNNEARLEINAKKTTNIVKYEDLFQNVLELKFNYVKTSCEIVVFFPFNKYHSLLKINEKENLKVLFYEEYLVIKSDLEKKPDYCLYLPIKKIALSKE